MPVQLRSDLALRLAQPLSIGAWDVDTLKRVLLQRLPVALQSFAQVWAVELMVLHPKAYAPRPKTIAKTLLDAPGFDDVFRYCLLHVQWPDLDLRPPKMAPTPAFAHLDLPQLTTIDALSDWLNLLSDRLMYFADPFGWAEEHGETAINHYRQHLVPKHSGGQRLIEAPKSGLKGLQRRILNGILNHVPPHKDAFGFVAGRNCLSAAGRHVGEAQVICFDLADYFPSIFSARVFGLFRSLGYPIAVADILTALCTTKTPSRMRERMTSEDQTTYRETHLPQGAPTSPALANLISFGLDQRLKSLADSLDANYSRYADDLTFSGDDRIVGPLLRTVPEIVNDAGFALNPSKTRVMPHKACQKVTGIVVNDHINIARKDFDQLKAVIHACGKPTDQRLTDPRFRAQLLGQIAWVETLNRAKGHKLRTLLEKAI